MKEQLEALATEMIGSIKDLKDLAKDELPEVAKEYISYNKKMAVLGIIGFGLILLVGAGLGGYAIFGEFKESHYMSDDPRLPYSLFGTIATMVGGIAFLCNLSNYLSFKLQPRRMAIKAITDLFQ